MNVAMNPKIRRKLRTLNIKFEENEYFTLHLNCHVHTVKILTAFLFAHNM